jgi:hypothetical protein
VERRLQQFSLRCGRLGVVPIGMQFLSRRIMRIARNPHHISTFNLLKHQKVICNIR